MCVKYTRPDNGKQSNGRVCVCVQHIIEAKLHGATSSTSPAVPSNQVERIRYGNTVSGDPSECRRIRHQSAVRHSRSWRWRWIRCAFLNELLINRVDRIIEPLGCHPAAAVQRSKDRRTIGAETDTASPLPIISHSWLTLAIYLRFHWAHDTTRRMHTHTKHTTKNQLTRPDDICQLQKRPLAHS